MPRSEKEGIPTFLLQRQPTEPVDPTDPEAPEVWTKSKQKKIELKKRLDALFPAGAYYVSIRPLEYQKPININGTDYYLGDEFNGEVREDETEKTQDFHDEVHIISNGNLYFIDISYPSSFQMTEAELLALYKET